VAPFIPPISYPNKENEDGMSIIANSMFILTLHNDIFNGISGLPAEVNTIEIGAVVLHNNPNIIKILNGVTAIIKSALPGNTNSIISSMKNINIRQIIERYTNEKRNVISMSFFMEDHRFFPKYVDRTGYVTFCIALGSIIMALKNIRATA